MRTPPRLCLLLLALLCAPLRAEAHPDEEGIIADVSDRRIAVTAGFTGAKTTVFGALPEAGDVIIVVTGPMHTVTVRRKERVLGIWLNRSAVSFQSVPGFYWLASSRPLGEIASDDFLKARRLKVQNLRFATAQPVSAPQMEEFRTALLHLRAWREEYALTPAPVTIMGQRLYRADLTLPASAPTGEYLVTTYLLKGGALIGTEQIPLTLRKEGTTAALAGLALRYPVLYAMVAILLALFSGWASAVLMQRR